MTTDQEIKAKVERFIILKHQIKHIDQKTKKLRLDIKPLKDSIKNYNTNNEKIVVTSGEAIGSNKSHHHRHKSLKVGYRAIESILGAEAKITVEKRLDLLRDELRNKQTKPSVLILPIGSSRKSSKDDE